MSFTPTSIADTARWVAVFRAEETKRSDRVFADPFAEQLAGVEGREMVAAMPYSSRHSWSFVARTHSIDQLIADHIATGFEVVVNLAAGLDTRPYRLKLPPALRWIEIDLPEMIAYKTAALASEKPVCHLQSMSIDLADIEARKNVFKSIATLGRRTLIISEGLVVYLTNGEVQTLAKDLHAHAEFKSWVLDMSSPSLVEIIKKEMGPHLETTGAAFKFAPAEGENFFLPLGWKPSGTYSMLKTAARINRLPHDLLPFAAIPEDESTYRNYPWSGVCRFQRV